MTRGKKPDTSMQLTLVVLSKKSAHFIERLLASIANCHCRVIELRYSHLAQTTASYILIDGDWNHIAKLESALDSLQKRLAITINVLRPDADSEDNEGISYSLETISLNRDNVVESIIGFLSEHEVDIEEIHASCYRGSYLESPVFTTNFVLLIPPQVKLLALREDLLDLCDGLNIDAIIEPIKR